MRQAGYPSGSAFPHVLVMAERWLDWRVVRERKRQGHGIFDRLSGSLPGMREHRVSRVAEQRQGTASPASQRVSVRIVRRLAGPAPRE